MHDPLTVAFSIRSPIKRDGYRQALITIWHVDPETDGSDDSCSWFLPKLNKKELDLAAYLGGRDNDIDNLKSWFVEPDRAEWMVARIMRIHKRETRWRWHPRWHFWHWEFQLNFIQTFWRRYFERCDLCNKKLLGETPTANWGGTKKWCQSCDELTRRPAGEVTH